MIFMVEGLDRGAPRGLMFDPDDHVKHRNLPPPMSVNPSTELEPCSRQGQSHEMWVCLVAQKLEQIMFVSLQGAEAHMSHPVVQVNGFMWKTNRDMWETSRAPSSPLVSLSLFSGTPFPREQSSQRCLMIDGRAFWLLNAGESKTDCVYAKA